VVVSLEAGAEWRYRFERPQTLIFASVSPREETVRLEVYFNDELVEKLTTAVPHSWWKWAGNALFPGGQAVEGDLLVVSVLAGVADMRIDFE
jgi:hypothetical protein